MALTARRAATPRGRAARARGVGHEAAGERHVPAGDRRSRSRCSVPAGSSDPEGEWQTLFLTAPSLSIRGGTDEIQRNIIGERVLGLPADVRVDRDVPFDALPRSARER